MASFEERVRQAKAKQFSACFESVAARVACKDRSQLPMALERSAISKGCRRRMLDRLLAVLPSYKISSHHRMDFKVWEVAVGIIDDALAVAPLNLKDLELFSITALFIAFKVDTLNKVRGSAAVGYSS